MRLLVDISLLLAASLLMPTCAWKSWEFIQPVGDMTLGNVPFVSMVWGGTSAAVNAANGDYTAAGLDLAFALWPVGGAVKSAVKVADETVLKTAEKLALKYLEKEGLEYSEKAAIKYMEKQAAHTIEKETAKAAEKGGLYAYWNKFTKQVDYIGISNDISRRHKEHMRSGKFDDAMHELLPFFQPCSHTAGRPECKASEEVAIRICTVFGGCTLNRQHAKPWATITSEGSLSWPRAGARAGVTVVPWLSRGGFNDFHAERRNTSIVDPFDPREIGYANSGIWSMLPVFLGTAVRIACGTICLGFSIISCAIILMVITSACVARSVAAVSLFAVLVTAGIWGEVLDVRIWTLMFSLALAAAFAALVMLALPVLLVSGLGHLNMPLSLETKLAAKEIQSCCYEVFDNCRSYAAERWSILCWTLLGGQHKKRHLTVRLGRASHPSMVSRVGLRSWLAFSAEYRNMLGRFKRARRGLTTARCAEPEIDLKTAENLCNGWLNTT